MSKDFACLVPGFPGPESGPADPEDKEYSCRDQEPKRLQDGLF
jgi:hypothetical protein